jgi:hypothetical protein
MGYRIAKEVTWLAIVGWRHVAVEEPIKSGDVDRVQDSQRSEVASHGMLVTCGCRKANH